MSDSLRLYGLYPARLLCPWGFSRQGYRSRLPCPPPGMHLPNPGIPHCRRILYYLSLQGRRATLKCAFILLPTSRAPTRAPVALRLRALQLSAPGAQMPRPHQAWAPPQCPKTPPPCSGGGKCFYSRPFRWRGRASMPRGG